MVVMDRQEYLCKAQNFLEQPIAYRPIPLEPTNKYKTRLIDIQRKIKVEIGMDDKTYRRMYPTGTSSPKFYGLPKVC